jgi:hypothetical protein
MFVFLSLPGEPMPVTRPEPSQRLVTQNLLALASLYEREPRVSWSTINHLSTLIDVACLYNQITVIGRQAYSVYPSNGSPLFSALNGSININEFATHEKQAAAIHLAAFLEDAEGAPRYQRLIEYTCTPDAVANSVRMDPDLKSDFRSAHEWLKALPNGSDPHDALRNNRVFHRAVTFLVRSFLYIAYAGEKQAPFAPDEVRAEALEPVMVQDRGWRQEVLNSIKTATDRPTLYADINISRHTTPFASVVFKNARTRQDIGQEILSLREKLAPTRARLVEAEDALYWVRQQDEARARERWNGVFEELKKQFGEGHGIVSLRSAVGYAEKGAEAVLDQSKLVKLIGLPIEIVTRYLARRPVIEIHKVAQELPGSRQLRADIQRLFGDVTP